MEKIFRRKGNGGGGATSYKQIADISYFANEGSDLLSVRILLISGVEVDTELTAPEVEALFKAWNQYL